MTGNNEWDTEVYKDLKKFYSKWNLGAGFFQTLYVFLAVLAIIAPLAVVAFSTTSTTATPVTATPAVIDIKTTFEIFLNKLINLSPIIWMRFFAFAGAVSIGLINSINFEEKAQNFRKASDHLYLAILRRQINEVTETQLVESFHEAQEMIGSWKFKPPKNTVKP